MVKIVLLLYRRSDLSADEFRRYWRERHRPLLERLPGLRRLVLNDILPGPDGAPAVCDGIAEDWFDSPEAMQVAFASAEGQAVAADAANFLEVSRLQLLVVDALIHRLAARRSVAMRRRAAYSRLARVILADAVCTCHTSPPRAEHGGARAVAA